MARRIIEANQPQHKQQPNRSKTMTSKTFTKIKPQEQGMYIRLEAVIPYGAGQNSDCDIAAAINEALDYLRQEGTAEITEAYPVEESQSDSEQVLRQRRINGDMRLEEV